MDGLIARERELVVENRYIFSRKVDPFSMVTVNMMDGLSGKDPTNRKKEWVVTNKTGIEKLT